MQFSNCTEKDSKNIAKHIAKCITKHTKHAYIIHLYGTLGAGKTTFARSFIQWFGFKKVKSPTYSIVEPYENATTDIKIYHFDLYRLCDFEELEMIGVREYFDNICLIEWADNFTQYLPKSDLDITLSGTDKRNIQVIANTDKGEMLLQKL